MYVQGVSKKLVLVPKNIHLLQTIAMLGQQQLQQIERP